MPDLFEEFVNGRLWMDDWLWGLKEYDEFISELSMPMRVQEVQIIREGEKLAFVKYLGTPDEFLCGPFVIPGAVQDPLTGRITTIIRVGKGLEMADERRASRLSDREVEFNETTFDTMLRDMQLSIEEGKKQQTKESVSGPLYRKERN